MTMKSLSARDFQVRRPLKAGETRVNASVAARWKEQLDVYYEVKSPDLKGLADLLNAANKTENKMVGYKLLLGVPLSLGHPHEETADWLSLWDFKAPEYANLKVTGGIRNLLTHNKAPRIPTAKKDISDEQFWFFTKLRELRPLLGPKDFILTALCFDWFAVNAKGGLLVKQAQKIGLVQAVAQHAELARVFTLVLTKKEEDATALITKELVTVNEGPFSEREIGEVLRNKVTRSELTVLVQCVGLKDKTVKEENAVAALTSGVGIGNKYGFRFTCYGYKPDLMDKINADAQALASTVGVSLESGRFSAQALSRRGPVVKAGAEIPAQKPRGNIGNKGVQAALAKMKAELAALALEREARLKEAKDKEPDEPEPELEDAGESPDGDEKVSQEEMDAIREAEDAISAAHAAASNWKGLVTYEVGDGGLQLSGDEILKFLRKIVDRPEHLVSMVGKTSEGVFIEEAGGPYKVSFFHPNGISTTRVVVSGVKKPKKKGGGN